MFLWVFLFIAQRTPSSMSDKRNKRTTRQLNLFVKHEVSITDSDRSSAAQNFKQADFRFKPPKMQVRIRDVA